MSQSILQKLGLGPWNWVIFALKHFIQIALYQLRYVAQIYVYSLRGLSKVLKIDKFRIWKLYKLENEILKDA